MQTNLGQVVMPYSKNQYQKLGERYEYKNRKKINKNVLLALQ